MYHTSMEYYHAWTGTFAILRRFLKGKSRLRNGLIIPINVFLL